MSHHCHAINCKVPTKPEMFMCLDHWKKVPKYLRDAIKATYRPGQCKDKNPSRAWVENTMEARRIIKEMEKQP